MKDTCIQGRNKYVFIPGDSTKILQPIKPFKKVVFQPSVTLGQSLIPVIATVEPLSEYLGAKPDFNTELPNNSSLYFLEVTLSLHTGILLLCVLSSTSSSSQQLYTSYMQKEQNENTQNIHKLKHHAN